MSFPHFVIRLEDDQQTNEKADSLSYISDWFPVRQWADLKRQISNSWGSIDREYPGGNLLRMPKTLRIDVAVQTADGKIHAIGGFARKKVCLRCFPPYDKRHNFDNIAIKVRSEMLNLKRFFRKQIDGIDPLFDSFPIPGLEDVAAVTTPDFIHDLRKQDTGLACCW